jgi:Tfp pilus assembly protein PilW
MRLATMDNRDPERNLQSGLTLVELLVAVACGILMMGVAGRFFLTNLKTYMEIKKTVAMQVSVKKSLQVMTRQISNAGGWLPNPRNHFLAQYGRIQFAYFDIEKRYCDVPDTLLVSFYTSPTNRGNAVVEAHACGKHAPTTRTIAESPANGSLDLSFAYFDADGAPTMNAARIKAVKVNLALRSGMQSSLPQDFRSQSLQVNMVNL